MKAVTFRNGHLTIEGNPVEAVIAYTPGRMHDGTDFELGYKTVCGSCHGEHVVSCYNEADRVCEECSGGEWLPIIEDHSMDSDDFSDLELWACSNPKDERAKVIIKGMHLATQKRSAA